jgi:hypothetical protein
MPWHGRRRQGCQRRYIFIPKIPTLLYFGMGNVGTVDMEIWNILLPFGILYIRTFGNFMVTWYIFSPFWYIVLRKIWQPWAAAVVIW